jgi:hypothetical protein
MKKSNIENKNRILGLYEDLKDHKSYENHLEEINGNLQKKIKLYEQDLSQKLLDIKNL